MRRRHPPTLVICIILVCLLAVVVFAAGTLNIREAAPVFLGGAGGGKTRKIRALESQNLIIDTLNLTHWLNRKASKKLETCDILAAIETTAPIIRRRFSGRIIYVTKDRETRAVKEKAELRRALYQAAARRCNVYVHVVERLPDEKVAQRGKKKSHSALGRDDFYLIMLAWKYNCPVLSQDRFRDLADMKSDLASFHVYSYSPVKNHPERDFVNPAAAEFWRMPRPTIIDYSTVLPHL